MPYFRPQAKKELTLLCGLYYCLNLDKCHVESLVWKAAKI